MFDFYFCLEYSGYMSEVKDGAQDVTTEHTDEKPQQNGLRGRESDFFKSARQQSMQKDKKCLMLRGRDQM